MLAHLYVIYMHDVQAPIGSRTGLQVVAYSFPETQQHRATALAVRGIGGERVRGK